MDKQPTSFGLSNNDLQKLLGECLKPEEISGDAALQLARIKELVRWFRRFADGNANAKWVRGHAFELAYYIATQQLAPPSFTPSQIENAFYAACNMINRHLGEKAVSIEIIKKLHKEYMELNFPPSK